MTDMNKVRDENAKNHTTRYNSSQDWMQYEMRKCGELSYIQAWNDCLAHLSKQSVAFDEIAAGDKAEDHLKQVKKDFPGESIEITSLKYDFQAGAEWQHQQTALIYEAKLAVAVDSITKALDQLEVFNFAKDSRRVDNADTILRGALEKLGAK